MRTLTPKQKAPAVRMRAEQVPRIAIDPNAIFVTGLAKHLFLCSQPDLRDKD
jgi:hypothetical protein